MKRAVPILLLLGILTILVAHSAAAQLYVNEMMSSNVATSHDDNGDASDWIEIYNDGPAAVNLSGYYLTDTPSKPREWIFPDITINTSQYLIVWASGKDHVNGSNIHTNFSIKASGEPIILTAPDGTTIVSQIPAVALATDQSYGRYPDGSTNLTILPAPTPGASNVVNITPGNTSNSSNTTTVSSNLSINEMMSSNVVTILDEDGDPSDWIELYNNGSTVINLTGYYLTDTASNLTEWKFPEHSIGPNQYLLVWASNKDRGNATAPLHTNFAIKAGGEPIILTAPDGTTIISQFAPVALTADQSYGRLPDGSANLGILPAPSPGANNSVLPPPTAPVFSKGAGFYSTSFLLAMTGQPNTTIYYTLDGSVPNTTSFRYNSTINISNATSRPNVVSMFNGTSPQWAPPPGTIRKATVVRAIAVRDNQTSRVISATYFLDGNFTMPVISISADNATLFDYYTGIYAMGAYWDNATGWDSNNVFHPANYENDGDAWERPAHLEIFWNNGSRVVNQDIGLRVTGQGSRVRPQKSMKFYARAEYGASTILFPLFPQQNFTDYKRLSIRNGDDDLRATYLRDILAHRLAEGSPLAMEPYYPSVVFMNGEYWGFYPMRDRDSQFYLASRYGVNKDDVIILNNNAEIDQGNPGDEQSYTDMVEYVRTHDMSDAANYAHVQTLMDTTDFARYYAVNTFVANTDWIDRNMVYWRLRGNGTNTSAPFGWDGRWRWIMHDDDWTFGFQPGTSASTNMFSFMDSKTWGAVLWDGLSKNEQFRDTYVTVSADNLNTNFSTNNVITQLDSIATGIAPELQREIDRWGDIPDNATWQQNLENIRQFARDRPAIHEQHIAAFFGLAGTATLSVDKTGDGTVSVNSLTPATYPWNGVEFKDVPVTLNATPAAGSMFIGWEGAVSGTDPQIKVVLSQATNVRAIFAPVGSNDTVDTAQAAPVWFARKYPATYVTMFDNQTTNFVVEIRNPAAPAQKTWLLDGIPVQSGNLNYTPNMSVGVHTLAVSVTVDNTTVTQSWSITVKPASPVICYGNVQQLPVNCTGTIASDTLSGCRTVVCNSASGSVSVMACNKPSDTNPTYYEMYRTAYSGQPPQVCLGQTCIQDNGYMHANLPACVATAGGNASNASSAVISVEVISVPPGILSMNGTQIGMTPQVFEITAGNWNVSVAAPGYATYSSVLTLTANVTINVTLSNGTGGAGNGTSNQTCYATLQNMPVNCTGGTIVQDTYTGCRQILCANGTSSLQVLACDKPTAANPTDFEMYKQGQNGTAVSKICIGNTCIGNNGFAVSSNYPICLNSTVTNTTNQTGTGNSTQNISLVATAPANNVVYLAQSGNQTFNLSISNPSNLSVYTTWSINSSGGGAGGGSPGVTAYTFVGASNAIGTYTVRAIVSSSQNNISAQWTLFLNETVQTNTTNTTNATNSSTTCYSSVLTMPANCTGGAITSDTALSNGCRSIVCANGGNVLQIQACNKPGNFQPQYFELYRQTASGTAPKICIGQACIQDNGYAQSSLFPICLNSTGNNTGGNSTGNTTDTTPPVISNGLPSGILPAGTTSATLRVTTDEPAMCRFDTQSGTPFASMSIFAATGGVTHTQGLSGLAAGSFTYFVRCMDAANNTNAAPFAVAFSIANATNTTNATSAVQLQIAPWYPQGRSYIFICNATGYTPASYDWYLGDGDKLLNYQQNNVYHTYAAAGAYNVSCTARGTAVLSSSLQATVN